VPTAKKSDDGIVSLRLLSPRRVVTLRDTLHVFRLLKKKIRLDSWKLTVVVVSSAAMRGMNRRFHGRDRSTDVLCFDLGPLPQDGRRCADIVVCADCARRRARQLGVSVKEELVRYIVHGVLHLTGYDDTAPAARRRLWRRQEELVAYLMEKFLDRHIPHKKTKGERRTPNRIRNS